jgi:hypothetical protein
MQQITFGSNSNNYSPKQVKFDQQVEMDDVEKNIDLITKWSKDTDLDHVLVVYGMGGQTKKVYNFLRDRDEIRLLWSGPRLPKYLRFLNGIISSYAGLMVVHKIEILKELFTSLSENSMVGIYICFNKDVLVEMETVVANNIHPEALDDLVSTVDLENLIYQVDADNNESITGIYEIISHGPNCPIDLIKCFSQ